MNEEFEIPHRLDKKLIYLHGFGSSGDGSTVNTLRELLKGWTVIAPDIPVDPAEALPFLKDLCKTELPDIIVGTSMGGMYAQQMRGFKRICINPAFDLPRHKDILFEGTFEFLNPRKDGKNVFTITPEIIKHYAEMERHQFEGITKDDRERVLGLFADNDTTVNCEDIFCQHYNNVIHFHGEHRLNRQAIEKTLVPLVREYERVLGVWKEEKFLHIRSGEPDDITPAGSQLFRDAGILAIRQKDVLGIPEIVEIDLDRLTTYEMLDGVLKICWVRIPGEKYDNVTIAGNEAELVKDWLDGLFVRSKWRHCPLNLSIRYLTNSHESSIFMGKKREPKKYIGEQIFTTLLSDKEIEQVRMEMRGAKTNYLLHQRILDDVKRFLDKELGMDCFPGWIEFTWAPGEYGRLSKGIRYLDKEDLQKMLSVIKEKGEGVSREELIKGLEDCCVRKEVWTRETGHSWTKYTLLARTPSQEEREYADTWDVYPVRLKSFPVKAIIEMLKDYIK